MQPSFRSADIIDALMLASQIFNQQPSNGEQRALVLFSDMRNHTRDLDLESPSAISAHHSPAQVFNIAPVDLRLVQVYALGVDGAGQTTAYWQGLESFWREYFHEAGARLNDFLVLRELPTAALP